MTLPAGAKTVAQARPGDRSKCLLCSVVLTLDKVGEIAPGVALFGWRRIRGERSTRCPSIRSTGAHIPDRRKIIRT